MNIFIAIPASVESSTKSAMTTFEYKNKTWSYPFTLGQPIQCKKGAVGWNVYIHREKQEGPELEVENNGNKRSQRFVKAQEKIEKNGIFTSGGSLEQFLSANSLVRVEFDENGDPLIRTGKEKPFRISRSLR